MAEPTHGALATLAAEVRAELPLIDRTVRELDDARPAAGIGDERIRLYATAALLDTFYTGVERLLERIARQFGAVPSGPHGHADLLAAAGLSVPGVRPPVLSSAAVAALRRYPGFRHRFRNLYLFDLDLAQMMPLWQDAPAAWATVRGDLEAFADELLRLAAVL